MPKRKVIHQKPRRKATVQGSHVEHVRVKVRKDGSEEISVFGPQQQQSDETQDQQTAAQRRALVYGKSETADKDPTAGNTIGSGIKGSASTAG